MKPYINIISPQFLDFMGRFSPLGVGGIGNMTIAPLIISREPMSGGSETHEAIHILQTYEVATLGSLVLLPLLFLAGVPWWGLLLALVAGYSPIGWFNILYGLTFLYWNLTVRKPRDSFDKLSPGKKAYYLIPFEREAYLFDQDGLGYLKNRKLFAWLRIKKAEDAREGAELSEKLFDAYEDNHSLAVIFTKVEETAKSVSTKLVELLKDVDPKEVMEDIQAFIEKYDLEDEVEQVKAYLEQKIQERFEKKDD